MDCVEFSNLLDNYAKLTKDQLSELEAHALVCDKCKSELIFFKSIMNTVASLPQAEPPADLLERINSKIDDIDSDVHNVRGGIFDGICFNLKRYSTIAACIMIGIIVGINNRTFKDIVSFDDGGVIDEHITTTESVNEHQDYAVPMTSEIPENSTVTDEIHKPAISKPEISSVIETKKPVSVKSAGTYMPTQSPYSNKQNIDVTKETSPQSSNNTENHDTYIPPAVSPTVVPEEITESKPDANKDNVVKPQQNTAIKEKYTIAQRYYLPDDYPVPTVVPTEATTVENYSINGDKYQIAYGYDLSEDEIKEISDTIADQVIINSSDSDAVMAILSNLNIQSTDLGYTASIDVFASFLAELDANGLSYSHVSNSGGNNVVTFKLMLN